MRVGGEGGDQFIALTSEEIDDTPGQDAGGKHFAKHCSGVSVTVVADEMPMSFTHFIRYDTHEMPLIEVPLQASHWLSTVAACL